MLCFILYFRVELSRHPGHKRPSLDILSEKENGLNLCDELYPGKYERGGGGLGYMNANDKENRYGDRFRNALGGLR